MARVALDGAAEIKQILLALDQGTVMIRFFRRRRQPENRIFCLKTDTFEILQYPMQRGKHTPTEESSKSDLGHWKREGRREQTRLNMVRRLAVGIRSCAMMYGTDLFS